MKKKTLAACTLGSLCTAAAAHADVIVQEGLIGELGEVPIILDQFDDQGGTRQLNFVRIDLYSYMHGGFTTSGSGVPVFVSFTYDQDYYLDDQLLAGTHCHFEDTLPNYASAAYSFWITDDDQAIIDDPDGMSPWIGDGTIAVTSIGDFRWYADPPEDILDGGAGLYAEYTFTYDFTILSACPEDLNADQQVDIDDLFAVLAAWGACNDCPEDVNGDEMVDIDDVFAVLAAWGPCP
ncbi:MAG: hypothetical protein JSV91_01665 [Phycisphaerales bacterium]|nr:MAG: hypothetical protein JSV91_01665 [Phycisphaerales bacterium]